METKYVKIPFDLELAKRIVNKEVDGKIITGDGRNVRVICWDSKAERDYPIIALIEDGKKELVYSYRLNGNYNSAPSNETAKLVLEVPEYMIFKDGDIVTFGWGNKDGKYYCEWISIIKSIEADEHEIFTEDYVSVYLKCDGCDLSQITFDCYSDGAKWARYSTIAEKQKLIEALNSSKNLKAKKYLKRFFNINTKEKQEYEFTFKQDVLVRQNNKDIWCHAQFSHKTLQHYVVSGGNCFLQCIPYNEETAHLLGTNEDFNFSE